MLSTAVPATATNTLLPNPTPNQLLVTVVVRTDQDVPSELDMTRGVPVLATATNCPLPKVILLHDPEVPVNNVHVAPSGLVARLFEPELARATYFPLP